MEEPLKHIGQAGWETKTRQDFTHSKRKRLKTKAVLWPSNKGSSTSMHIHIHECIQVHRAYKHTHTIIRTI